MTSLLIHDSGRPGKVSWATQVVQAGDAAGLILSPWETPPVSVPRRPSASNVADLVRSADGSILFDPETHGIFMRGANRRAIYDQWRLWPRSGPSKDMGAFADHVEMVAEIQESLDVSLLSPTVCLEAPAGGDADLVIEVFAHMRSIAGTADWHAALVGTPSFWAAGPELDTFVGRVATLRPRGAVLSVLRTTGQYPWGDLTPEEVAGVCRTTRSLSVRMPVTIGRSDFAGLPAVAAGADAIGAGWDLKQRILSADLYRDSPGIRRQSERISHAGLFASLKRREAERLRAGDRGLSVRLVPGGLPLDFNGRWRHHLSVLANLARTMGGGDVRSRVASLQNAYSAATIDFAEVARFARPMEATEAQWVSPLADGLTMFADAEGI